MVSTVTLLRIQSYLDYIGPKSNGHTKVILDEILDEAQNVPHQATPDANERLVGPSLGQPEMQLDNGTVSAPQSPYTANCALIRDLTLPIIPNLNIPDSPPGSLPSDMEQKFGHFLELKKQGLHFNEKLARSSALKNPSLLTKLMDFAGIETNEQYSTILPLNIWNPTGFPTFAFKEELNKTQEQVHKRKEEQRAKLQRESIDFVSASVSGQSGRAGSPSLVGVSKGLRGSAVERVMMGLSREPVRSSRMSNLVSRNNTSGRGIRTGDRDSPWKARSRSPARQKRSRSR